MGIINSHYESESDDSNRIGLIISIENHEGEALTLNDHISSIFVVIIRTTSVYDTS